MLKKISALVLAFILLFGTILSTSAADNTIYGDINGDKVVNSLDVLIGLKKVLGVDTSNGSSTLTMNDVYHTLLLASGGVIKSDLFSSAKEVESMSDERLLELFASDNYLNIPNFYVPDNFGVPFIDGEQWGGSISSSSAKSATQAVSQIEEFGFVKSSDSYDIEYIGENQYYYSFRITCSHIDNETMEPFAHIYRYFVYKESAKYITFNNQTGYYFEIRALDKKSVLDLLDFEAYLWFRSGTSIIYRDFEETATEYIYTFYTINRIWGDWGMSDTAILGKSIRRVDKKTGKYLTHHGSTQTLKQVTIPGTYHTY